MKVYIVKATEDTKHLSSVLFPLILEKETGEQVRYEDIIRNESGKPVLKDGPESNISHSGNYWCIVFDDMECGIDIEVNRHLHSYMERKVLHPDERPFEDNLLKTWCIKEAYVKMIGVGFGVGIGPATIKVNEIEQECTITDLCNDEYCCYVAGSSKPDAIFKLYWDNIDGLKPY
jgi:phosphopantetheinyl transferase